MAASPDDCRSWGVGRRRGLCPCRMCTVLFHIVAAQRTRGVHETKQCTVCALSMQGTCPHHPGPPAPTTPMPARAPAATTQYATAQPSLPGLPLPSDALPSRSPIPPLASHSNPAGAHSPPSQPFITQPRQALRLSALCLRPGVAQACTSQPCACHPYLQASQPALQPAYLCVVPLGSCPASTAC